MWKYAQPKLKKRYIGWSIVLLTLVYLLVSPLGVQGTSSIAQGFQTSDESITAGTLVSARQDDPNTVVPSSLENVDLMLGVVGENSAIDLSDDTSTIQVVRSGVTLALVSDINGDVQTGDHITASPIEGVGMRTVDNVVVAGVAQSGLDSADVSRHQITDRSGNERTVRIGLVPIQVDTMFYAGQDSDSSFVPGFLQEFADTLAGKQVSPVRVVVAALLLFLLFMSIVVLLYSATKSSIISIGRNPLSEKAVHKSLFEVGLTIIGLLAFSVILIYLILTI